MRLGSVIAEVYLVMRHQVLASTTEHQLLRDVTGLFAALETR